MHFLSSCGSLCELKQKEGLAMGIEVGTSPSASKMGMAKPIQCTWTKPVLCHSSGVVINKPTRAVNRSLSSDNRGFFLWFGKPILSSFPLFILEIDHWLSGPLPDLPDVERPSCPCPTYNNFFGQPLPLGT